MYQKIFGDRCLLGFLKNFLETCLIIFIKYLSIGHKFVPANFHCGEVRDAEKEEEGLVAFKKNWRMLTNG